MMKRYEKNIGKIMPIRNFGEYRGKEIKFCKLVKIIQMDVNVYYLDFFSEDMELLGSRWITGHMYRYHVLNKPY